MGGIAGSVGIACVVGTRSGGDDVGVCKTPVPARHLVDLDCPEWRPEDDFLDKTDRPAANHSESHLL